MYLPIQWLDALVVAQPIDNKKITITNTQNAFFISSPSFL